MQTAILRRCEVTFPKLYMNKQNNFVSLIHFTMLSLFALFLILLLKIFYLGGGGNRHCFAMQFGI